MTYSRREADKKSKISEVQTPAVCRRRVTADHGTAERRPFATTHITNTQTTITNYSSSQWRKPGPQFGGTKKNFAPSPNSKIGGGAARNSLFLITKQLNIV